MAMNPDDGSVDHPMRHVRLPRHNLEHTASGPAVEPVEDRVPAPGLPRKVPSGRGGPRDPQDYLLEQGLNSCFAGTEAGLPWRSERGITTGFGAGSCTSTRWRPNVGPTGGPRPRWRQLSCAWTTSGTVVLDIPHRRITASAGERVHGTVHIRAVNSRHSQIRSVLHTRRGIAIRYPDSNLRWFHLVERGDQPSSRACLVPARARPCPRLTNWAWTRRPSPPAPPGSLSLPGQCGSIKAHW